jgi:L-xylulose reductase
MRSLVGLTGKFGVQRKEKDMSMSGDRREFEGKIVLVTGAGKGIGRATAKRLVHYGAKVVALSRSAADLASLDAEIGSRSFAVDLADEAATRTAARDALPFDLLVNCAGTTTLDPFVELTTETFDHIMAVNTKAPMIIAQEYVRYLVGKGQPGAVVNVSSDAAFVGVIDHAAYCASKAALDAMSRVMANELGRHGIRVNCVNPTVTLTDMAKRAWSDPARSAPRLRRMPIGRFLEPDEIAEAIIYLLSPRAGAITGISVRIDGGFSVT